MTNETFPQNDPPETAPTEMTTIETPREKFERERLTRRQALKRFGMTSAMATFALFSVDDLARMVGGAMERQARNSKIAAQVAQEFQQAGVAFAGGPTSPGTSGGVNCADCCNHYQNSHDACYSQWCYCQNYGSSNCNADLHTCNNNALYAYNGCFSTWCQPLGMTCAPLTTPSCTVYLP